MQHRMPALAAYFLVLFAAVAHSAVVTISPHNSGVCTTGCGSQFVQFNYFSPKCHVFQFAAHVGSTSASQQVKFALTPGPAGINITCNCGGQQIGTIPAGEQSGEADIYYSSISDCGLVAKSFTNFSCNYISRHLNCGTVQPTALLSVDLSQEYPHCAVSTCIKTIHPPAKPKTCQYYQQEQLCRQKTNCVTTSSARRCRKYLKSCPTLVCPEVPTKICPQTPPPVPHGEWNCNNGTCGVLCDTGYVVSWLRNTPKQYAATCNHVSGRWALNVPRGKACISGNCHTVLSTKCAAPSSNCGTIKNYLRCGTAYGCADEIAPICHQYAKTCHISDCPVMNVTCADTPEAVENGEWSCDNTTCELLCSDGFYINWPVNANREAAAVCAHGTWDVIAETPSCLECKYGTWGPWTKCSASCGTGEQIRTRTVIGTPGTCAETTESQECLLTPCEPLCVPGQWSSWSNCSAICDGGVRSRSRELTPSCHLASTATEPCNTQSCNTTECEFSQWSAWSGCSGRCAEQQGTQTATRSLIKGDPQVCTKDTTTRQRQCNTVPCCAVADKGPQHNSTTCETQQSTITCGAGKLIEITYANYGRKNGKTCPHPSIRTTNCGAKGSIDVVRKVCAGKNRCTLTASNGEFGDPCANTFKYLEVHYYCVESECNCKANEWGAWQSCSASCGGGVQRRTRTLTGTCGGNHVPTVQTRDCATSQCTSCQKGVWSEWGTCSTDCGGGTQTRTRTVTGHPTSSDPCSSQDSRSCNELPCPIDCTYSAWAAWAACPVTCGGSRRVRTRILRAGNVTLCQQTTDYQPCNTEECPNIGPGFGHCDVPQCLSQLYPDNAKESMCEQEQHLMNCFVLANCTSSQKTSACQGLQVTTCPTLDCRPGCVYNYGQWGQCTRECGEGTQIAIGTLDQTIGTAHCADVVSKSRKCNLSPCVPLN